MSKLKAFITPLANDSFCWGAWTQEKIIAPAISTEYLDLETINQKVLKGEADLAKISLALLPEIYKNYVLLPVGATLVKGLGPKLVAKKSFTLKDLTHRTLYVPGKKTTAYLLTKNLLPPFFKEKDCPYQEIIPRILQEAHTSGLLIHESSFFIKEKRLFEFCDLGKLWFEKKNLWLPLGGVVAKRSLGKKLLVEIVKSLQSSFDYAVCNPQFIEDYILKTSPIKDKKTLRKSLKLWVNEETRSLSQKGKEAISELLSDPKQCYIYQF